MTRLPQDHSTGRLPRPIQESVVKTRPTLRAAALAGLFAGVVAHVSAADSIPGPVAKKTFDADVAFLEKGFSKTPANNAVGTLKAAAMLVAMNAQNGLGGKDDAAAAGARDKALEIALLSKKGLPKNSADVTKGLKLAQEITTAKATKTDKVDLIKAGKLGLHEIMSAYRPATSNGMNLELDIKAYGKKVTDVDAAALLATRNALIAMYTKDLGDDAKADNATKKKQWAELTAESLEISQAIIDETNKGAKADKVAIEKKFTVLHANCNACHTAFKD